MVDLNVLRQAAESEIAARDNGDTSDLWQDAWHGCRLSEMVGLAMAVTIAHNAAQDLRDGVEL